MASIVLILCVFHIVGMQHQIVKINSEDINNCKNNTAQQLQEMPRQDF